LFYDILATVNLQVVLQMADFVGRQIVSFAEHLHWFNKSFAFHTHQLSLLKEVLSYNVTFGLFCQSNNWNAETLGDNRRSV